MENDGKPVERWVDDQMATLTPDEHWEPDEARAWAEVRAGRHAPQTRRHGWFWLVAGATAASLALVTMPVARGFAARCGELVVRTFSASGSSHSDAGVPGRSLMPNFTLPDRSGQAVSLSDFRGNVVLLNFWTTSCGQCQVEIPWFAEFQQRYGNRDFVVLGISLDRDGWTTVNPYVDAKRINYRVMVGNDDVAKLRGSRELMPTTLIIDRSGRVAVTHVGFCSKTEYETDIQKLLAED